MLSIIICSINPEYHQKIELNIKETIGIQFEIIAFDNRNTSLGLAAVYNLCAEKAQYKYLCFVHEDLEFKTPGWGSIILNKLKEESCGVIGFAGSTSKTKSFSGWGTVRSDARLNYTQRINNKTKKFYRNPEHSDYLKVITLDGLCLFVRKDVWSQNQFDEETFNRFHLYDLDFTFAIAQTKNNYVCYDVEIVHFSGGSYNASWIDETLKFHKKWENKLPMYINPVSTYRKRRNESLVSYKFIKKLLKEKANYGMIKSYISNHLKAHPFEVNNLSLLIKLAKYISKR